MPHDDLSRLLSASVELETLRKDKAYHEPLIASLREELLEMECERNAARVHAEQKRRVASELRDRAQEVFDELCDRLMKARKHNYEKQRSMATELMQAGWDMGLNTDDLCDQYAESLDDANDEAAESVVGG